MVASLICAITDSFLFLIGMHGYFYANRNRCDEIFAEQGYGDKPVKSLQFSLDLVV